MANRSKSKPQYKPYMTQAEFARYMDVARSRVTQLKKQGRLVLEDGQVDVEATIQQLKATTDPAQNSSFADSPVADSQAYDYQRQRARKEYYQACLIELDLKERVGELVPVAEVIDDASQCASTMRDNILSIPSRVAPTIAAMDDEDRIEQFLVEEIEKALRVTSKYLRERQSQ